jgi:hypothetical protein
VEDGAAPHFGVYDPWMCQTEDLLLQGPGKQDENCRRGKWGLNTLKRNLM